MQKEDFVDDLKDDGLDPDWLARTVTLPNLSSPGTLEESTRTIADFCVNVNALLQVYNGIPLVDYNLRGGQRNSSLNASVLLSSEGYPIEES
jgi:hypothetical protein